MDTFEAIGHNLAIFVPIALLAQFPGFVFNLLTASAHSSGTEFNISFGYLIRLRTTADTIEAFVALACFGIAQAALAFVTVAGLNGRRESLANSLLTAIRSALPLIGITIVSTLATIVGILMLIVPGVILALGWVVAVPVCVIERRSTFESFRQSWLLTTGHRLAILGVMIISIAGTGIVLRIIMSLGGTLAITAGGGAGAVILWITRLVMGCAISMFAGSFVGVIYYELYFIKEGHAPGALASVFD